MKHLIQTLFFLSLGFAVGQDARELNLNTEIKDVTVFIQGAEITRTGTTRIPKGESIIKATGLSPYINSKSITAKATGDFIILSVNHKLNYLESLKNDKRIDSLEQIVDVLDLKISRIRIKQEVLNERLNLLHSNDDFGGNAGVSLENLKGAVEYFEKEVTEIKSSSLDNQLQIKKLEVEKVQVLNEINVNRSRKTLPTSEVYIRVKAESATTGKFKISYPVENAGWFPKYDIRVKSIEKPMLLEYKADVYQNTGIDWNNVKLQLSTADPNQSGVLPNLKTWFLNFERNTRYQKRDYSNISSLTYDENEYRSITGQITDDTGEPLPGVNVVIKGTTTGTTTDLDGNYKILVSGDDNIVFSYVGFDSQEMKVGNRSTIDVALGGVTELQEVVITGYGGGVSRSSSYRAPKPKAEVITTRVVQKTTSFVFEVELPYSIKSTGQRLTVDLKKHDLDANYKYYSIPKIDTDAFLIAELTDWNQYNLLEGEANLFFEGTFVGQTILNPDAFGDTLDISLGRDKSIAISREPLEEFAKRKLIGGNKVERRAYQIKVMNQKNHPVNLTVFDQIPIPVINSISVSLEEKSGGDLNEETGEISWKMNLKPKEIQDKKLAYQVKYPKYERVELD